MKRTVGLMVLFLLLGTFIVTAGDVLKLDFTKQGQYIAGLKEGDMTEFYLNGERNVIIIDEIKPNSVDVTAFIALNTRNYPYYTTLSKDRTLKLDVERDDIDDLFVTFYKSDEDLKHVYLLMKKPEIIPVTGSVVKDAVTREKRGYDKFVIASFILVVGLLVFLIFKRKKQKDDLL